MNIKDVIKFANNDYSVAVKPRFQNDNPLNALFEKTEIKAIQEARKNLKEILKDIINNQGILKPSEQLDHFIEIGNNISKHYSVKDGRLIEENKINELSLRKAFLLNYPVWLINIISTFIEYLLKPEKYLRKIRKCDDCKKFFIQSKLYERQKYCSDCSKKNHTPKDIQAERTRTSRKTAKKLKDKIKRKILYERQYERLIQAGYSQKQAQKEANEYVIEQLGVIE